MKLKEFIKNVYAPGLHIAYSGLWFLSLMGTMVLVQGCGSPWVFDMKVIGAVSTLFLVLFFLRVADELKDLEYDRLHNPDRPLVKGLVTKRDLYIYMAFSGGIVALINIWISWYLLAIVILDMLWGLILITIEKSSQTHKNNMFLNLLITYPVNIALGIYTYVFFMEEYGAVSGKEGIMIVVAFAFAFLNYEFSRKIAWPHLSKPSERLYSNALGGVGASLITLMFALIPLAILVFLIEPGSLRGVWKYAGWIILIPAVPAVYGFSRFIAERNARKKYAVYGMGFLMLFYLTLCVLAFGANTLSIK